MRRRLPWAAVSGIMAATVAGAAGQSAPGGTQRFSSRADVVVVDVSVLDRKHQPVRDLSAQDFTILEDGRQQSIERFEHIELPDPPSAQASWMRDFAPDVSRNDDILDRRLIVILMDDAMIPFDAQMVSSARKIGRDIVDRLGPGDLAAVVFTRANRAAQNFTGDRARLFAAMDAFDSAGYVPEPGAEKQANPVFLSSTQALFYAVDALAAVPDRRKTLIYVSTGVPLVVDTPDVSRTDQPYLNWLIRQTIRRAQRGSVNIYPIDPGGLDGLRGYMLARNRRPESWIVEQIEQAPTMYREFLQTVADNTGGHAFSNTNEFASRVDQIFRETGSFYLLGYRPQNQQADGRFRRLRVRVNRPGITVRARSGYYAPPSGSEAKMAAAHPESTNAIAGFVPTTDLPLELAAAPFHVPGRPAAVILTLGVRSPRNVTGTFINADALFGAFTPQGEPRGSTRIALRVPRSVGTAELSYEVLGRLDLQPGRYEIRASASGAAPSPSGSVYAYVDVPDFTRVPVSLSGVTIDARPAPASGNSEAVAGVLEFSPTSRRAFAATDRVASFLRIYFGGTAPAEPATLLLRVIDSADRIVVEERRTFHPESFGATRSADVRFELPLTRLSSGPYALILEASLATHTARRAVRFDVK